LDDSNNNFALNNSNSSPVDKEGSAATKPLEQAGAVNSRTMQAPQTANQPFGGHHQNYVRDGSYGSIEQFDYYRNQARVSDYASAQNADSRYLHFQRPQNHAYAPFPANGNSEEQNSNDEN
jgi:hypothetical protein